MRILNIIAQKPHSTGSGVYLTQTVREMADMGHDVAVVAGVTHSDAVYFPPKTAFFPVFYETPELPFPVCGMSDEMPYASTVYRTMTEDMLARFKSAFERALVKAVDSFRPDVIICHHLYILAALARRLFPGMALWGLCHGSDIRQMLANPLRLEEVKRGVAGLDRVFCLHREQAENVVSLYGVDPKKTYVVGVGYDSRVFFDRGLRKPHGETRIIFAGKISEKKGVYSLISSLDRLGLKRGDFSLRLAGGCGSDEIKQTVIDKIDKSGWDARLLGALSPEQLARELCLSDVFVLPSFYEGLPLVLAEAMACGAKVVCTDLMGIRPWMDETVPGNGIAFVTPPAMTGADTPDPQSLPRFEAELAKAILESAAKPYKSVDLSRLKWSAVVKRMLEAR